MRTIDGLQFTDMGSSARLSLDGQYRYELVRRWNRGPLACWIMLNPSTADASVDDRTIRKCIKFTQAWNLSGLVVVNLFAYRATDPKALKTVADPVGPENDEAIYNAVRGARITVAGWGVHGTLHGRNAAVLDDVLGDYPGRLYALDVTRDGHPKHPLYIRDATRPTPYIEHEDGNVRPWEKAA